MSLTWQDFPVVALPTKRRLARTFATFLTARRRLRPRRISTTTWRMARDDLITAAKGLATEREYSAK